jgi:hypothetical protein
MKHSGGRVVGNQIQQFSKKLETVRCLHEMMGENPGRFVLV